MSDAERPDPDEILARMKREETAAARGKLKIFFGMSPGVGKTFAMLQAARQKQAQGSEVVIGIVETHGRQETEALLEGLPIMPRAQLEYRDTTLNEMDLDAILTWHPGVAVVDELAHTNAPGSRHPKRYQDVLELLDAGIDVYTTLNVQHVASRSDVVRQISGVSVHETVPDSILDLADEIMLVDLTPDQLRARLAEGKVYLGERAEWAAKNFFRESNLTALREMALRLVAEHVDRDLRDIMSEQKIAGPWKSGDRLLVAVSASPYSERLIRYTRRLAASMEATWIVANIERPRALLPEEQTRLTRYLALARQLGAEVISTPGTNVAETLLRIARQHNVTQIVIGKPLGPRWTSFWKRDPLRWLIRNSGNIDIHMIPAEESAPPPRETIEQRLARAPWRDFGIALAIAAGVTGLSLAIFAYTGYSAVALFYLLAVVLAGTRLRRWPTLLLAALSALLWNFLFVPPRFTFYIGQFQDVMMFCAYFIIALVIGNLATQLRAREQSERRREERATALYRLTRALAASRDLDEALPKVLLAIKNSFQADAAVWLCDESGLKQHPASAFSPSSKDESVAVWTFQKKRSAGKSTDTLPDAEALHVPLVTGDRAEGVLSVRLSSPLTIEQRELLDAFASQLALFVNKERALEESRSAQISRQSQKLQKTLFDSVSHELKTPLAAISAALQQPQPDRAELQQAVRRLTRTVDHLLDATRLESGLLQPAREWCEPGELLREAVSLAGLKEHSVKVIIAENLPMIFVDAHLIEQALGALLSNAGAHGTSDPPIEVSAARDDSMLVFSVADHGPGLAPGEENKVFEKFYRGPGTPAGGLGLGLSIARQLVEAHAGQIIAQNREEMRGARFFYSHPDRRSDAASIRSDRMKPVALIIDDEVQIRRLLRVALESENYQVHEAENGRQGLTEIANRPPAIILLDLGLPDMDGLEVLKRLREWSEAPVLVLSVRDDEQGKVAALDAGAEDYVTKPFSTPELLARLRAAQRKTRPEEEVSVFKSGDLIVDLTARVVMRGGHEIKLTATEYTLLRLFVRHPSRVLTHRYILREIWGPKSEEHRQYLRVYVTHLRQKIEVDPTTPRLIKTESGIGYRFEAA